MKINNTGINVAGADTINSFVESLDSISTSKAAGAVTIVSGAAFAPSTDAGYAAFVDAANAVFAVGAGNNDVFAAHDVAGGGDAWVAVDENDNGSFDVGDTFIIVDGYAAATAITTLSTADFL